MCLKVVSYSKIQLLQKMQQLLPTEKLTLLPNLFSLHIGSTYL